MDTTKLDDLRQALADHRSGRVVLVSHCLLNPNVRYLGGVGRRRGADELVSWYQAAGVGIHQMPCPEQYAWGGVLKRRLLPVYGVKGTAWYRFRRPLTAVFLRYSRLRYRYLARRVVKDIDDYCRSGFEVVGIVGVGSSPSCGVLTTLEVDRALEVLAGYSTGSADAATLNSALMGSTIPGAGLFMDALRHQLARRHLDLPFVEHDLVAELRSNGLLR